jgi:6,7-dimethyl-8-ribityllumazine synthase
MPNNTTLIPSPLNAIKALMLFSIGLVLAGCNHVYKPKPSVRLEQIPSFTGSGEVALVNGQASKDDFVMQKAMGSTMSTDLHACTDVAITITQRELEKHGFHIAPGAAKTLAISVISLTTQTGAVKIETESVVHVVAGNGYSTKYVARNNSTMMANIQRQADGAIMRGVKEMLSDSKIIEYLTK